MSASGDCACAGGGSLDLPALLEYPAHGRRGLSGRISFLARHGLNQARLIVLVLLDNAENGNMRSSELAEHASVSRATITGLLDTLEKAGLWSGLMMFAIGGPRV